MQADLPSAAKQALTSELPDLPACAALFLDFDGTLVPIAPRPEDIRLPGWLVPTLEQLQRQLGGALAIVSGRALASLDGFLHPLALAAAGGHGAERRSAGGRVERRQLEIPQGIAACARGLTQMHQGVHAEVKPTGMAVHFRLRPELAERICKRLDQALEEAPDAGLLWEWMHGKFVYELKPRDTSKGQAVRAFLSEAPFAGRTPVFVGDDVTDEDGIEAAQSAGGFGVRVGTGASRARYRLADTGAVGSWLQRPQGPSP